jgi:hypothetical protein
MGQQVRSSPYSWLHYQLARWLFFTVIKKSFFLFIDMLQQLKRRVQVKEVLLSLPCLYKRYYKMLKHPGVLSLN